MKLLAKAALAKQVENAAALALVSIDFAALQKKSHPYCTGGYQRSALDRADHDFSVPVWYVSRSDAKALFAEDRQYISLRCVHEQALNNEEAFTYEVAKAAWQRLRTPAAPNPKLLPRQHALIAAAFA